MVIIELLLLLGIGRTSEKADKAFKEVDKTSKLAATRRGGGNKKGEIGKKRLGEGSRALSPSRASFVTSHIAWV